MPTTAPKTSCTRSIACATSLVRRDGQQVARIRREQHADELRAERRRRTRRRRRGEPRATTAGLRGRRARIDEECDPQPFEHEAERPQSARGDHSRSAPRIAKAAAASAQPALRQRGRSTTTTNAAASAHASARSVAIRAPEMFAWTPSQSRYEAAGDDHGQYQQRVAHQPSLRDSRRGACRHQSMRAAKAAAESLDFGMNPRAPQASIRRP